MKATWKIVICLSMFLLMLSVTSWGQNTKGDKPASTRETRFKKTGKTKPAKRVRSRKTSSLRAYTPRKKSKGGERAGQPLAPVQSSRPSERPRNVYPQSGKYVNNNARTPSNRDARVTPPRKKVKARTATAQTRNVYPQTGRYINNYTKSQRRSKANIYPQSGRFVNSSSSSDRPPRTRRKIIPPSASRSFIARKSINAWARFPKPRPRREKAYTGDIAGRRIRTKNYETKRPSIMRNDGGGLVRSRTAPPPNRNYRAGQFGATPKRRNTNVYFQFGKFQSNGRASRRTPGAVSNKEVLSQLKWLQSSDRRPRRKTKVVPRSASGSFIARRSTNAWAQFPRPKRKSERAFTKDIAGHPLRTKNYVSPKPGLIPQSLKPRQKKRVNDRAYQGPAGGYISGTRSSRPWKGDVTGRKVRGRNFFTKRSPAPPGGGYRTATRPSVGKYPIPVRPPGIGASGIGGVPKKLRSQPRAGFQNQGEEFTGNIKSGRPLKGGGSISNRRWNNNGKAIPGRIPGMGASGIGGVPKKLRSQPKAGFQNQGEEFTGNIKSGRPLKGGGSVSNRRWNNNGKAIPARIPGIGASGIGGVPKKLRSQPRAGFQNQGEEFTGNLKARRPLKGGGSISNRLWNNNGKAIPARVPGIGASGIGGVPKKLRSQPKAGFQNQGEEFTGNLKARRPLKGGGSVSNRLWNNKETPIPVRQPGLGAGIGGVPKKLRSQPKPGFQNQGEEFTGNIKAKRPLKGGGSVSDRLWNNKETPIPVRQPGLGGDIGGMPKKLRSQPKPGFQNQGEEFTGNLKQRSYVRNPNSAELALKKSRPRTTYDVDGLQVRVPQHAYGKRKGAPEESIPGLKPSKSSIHAGVYARSLKQNWKYIKNPSSSDDAIKVREPGKAFVRVTDYQGNIKMAKFELFGKRNLHPDAQFVKINKNNVGGEKDILTNFKLWWGRLFRKNETLPDHLKDRKHKPRYDKGEQGLWYD